jgi:hypothetical protein
MGVVTPYSDRYLSIKTICDACERGRHHDTLGVDV